MRTHQEGPKSGLGLFRIVYDKVIFDRRCAHVTPFAPTVRIPEDMSVYYRASVFVITPIRRKRVLVPIVYIVTYASVLEDIRESARLL